MTKVTTKRPLSGRKVTLMFCAAFTTIIGANGALIYSAIGSFPGLETRQPYIEAQSFEARRIAQERLNWASIVSYADGRITLQLTKASGGETVVIPKISMRVGKATSHQSDQTVTLEFDGHTYSTLIDLEPGNWQAQIYATALDGTDFRRTLALRVKSSVSS